MAAQVCDGPTRGAAALDSQLGAQAGGIPGVPAARAVAAAPPPGPHVVSPACLALQGCPPLLGRLAVLAAATAWALQLRREAGRGRALVGLQVSAGVGKS